MKAAWRGGAPFTLEQEQPLALTETLWLWRREERPPRFSLPRFSRIFHFLPDFSISASNGPPGKSSTIEQVGAELDAEQTAVSPSQAQVLTAEVPMDNVSRNADVVSE